MATNRPFAYNPSRVLISGTTQNGDLAIGNSVQNYSARYGGVRWWAGPDEDLGYIICGTVSTEDRSTPLGNIGSVRFWRSQEKTKDSIFNLIYSISDGEVTNPFEIDDWLLTNSMWCSYNIEPIQYVYNSPGPYTFTVPPDIYHLKVLCVGAGGAGGDANHWRGACGGGGGGASSIGIIDVQPGQIINVVVGMGSVETQVGTWGASYVGDIIAVAGKKPSNNNRLGGAGGKGTFNGGNGGQGSTWPNDFSGGGGGGAGYGDGSNAYQHNAGSGSIPGGDGADGLRSGNNGQPGNAFGGGGSGASGLVSNNYLGGRGGDGGVIIYWI